MSFVDLPTTGGEYFIEKDFASAQGLLIEPIAYSEDGKSNYPPAGTVNGSIPQVTARVTKFQTPDDVNNERGEDCGILKIQKPALVKNLKDLLGSATAATVKKLPPSSKYANGAWVIDPPADDVRSHIVSYYTKREAAKKAAAEEMPDFLK